MNVVCKVAALLATLCCVTELTEGAPTGVESRGMFYDWPCPLLSCPPIVDCREVEVVMWVHGSRLCEGCPYCMDRTYQGLRERRRGFPVVNRNRQTKDSRVRRSAKLSTDTLPVAQNEVCNFASCPLKRPTVQCTRPSVLDGYLHGNKCISCAFCIDDVTENSQEFHQGDSNSFLRH